MPQDAISGTAAAAVAAQKPNMLNISWLLVTEAETVKLE
jgi:hypothetical protein